MQDKRRVRFYNLSGLTRRDLPLISEVWLQDIQRAQWATREVMTLAGFLIRYVTTPDPALLLPWRMTSITRLEPDEVLRALQMMHANFVIEAFSIENGVVKVSLRLSSLQRLRVLESKLRLIELHEALGIHEPSPGDGWVPEAASQPAQGGVSHDMMIVNS